MILLRLKAFSVSSKNKALESLYETQNTKDAWNKWKKSKNDKDAADFISVWTEDVYIPARIDGFMLDPDRTAVNAAIRYHKRQYAMSKK
jgi:hypothetical protein